MDLQQILGDDDRTNGVCVALEICELVVGEVALALDVALALIDANDSTLIFSLDQCFEHLKIKENKTNN